MILWSSRFAAVEIERNIVFVRDRKIGPVERVVMHVVVVVAIVLSRE